MPKKSDAAVGRLAVMEGALNELLRDLVTEITGQDAKGLTGGKAAQTLLAHAKQDPALLTPDVTDWLKRADQAAQERNKVMHAVAQDQCVLCGNAIRFEHKGKPVDRSAGTVAAVSAEFRDLIDEAAKRSLLSWGPRPWQFCRRSPRCRSGRIPKLTVRPGTFRAHGVAICRETTRTGEIVSAGHGCFVVCRRRSNGFGMQIRPTGRLARRPWL